MELKTLLLNHTEQIENAAEAICTDKSFVYDTIYLAVIKTKQKYKRLANKERAADICISLMRQPRKHVKQSFTSVEDCIEKALAAKVIPWKSIISAVAVVLAAAIILPFCLPEKPLTIDPVGFVMENTESFGNTLGENGTYVKNYHNLKDLGGPDNALLAKERFFGGGGRIWFEILTMESGYTYLAYAYTRREQGKEPQCEVILYRAETDGWDELGRISVGTFVSSGTTATTDGENVTYEDYLYYRTGEIVLLEYDGTLYIVSSSDDGIQIHRYTERNGIGEVARAKLGEKKNYSGNSFSYDNMWNHTMVFCYNESKERYDFAYTVRTTPSYDETHQCYIYFDPKTETLSEPIHRTEPEFLGLTPTTICADENGTLYFTQYELLDTTSEYTNGAGTSILSNSGLYLYRYDGQFIERVSLISDPKVSTYDPRLFRFKDGALEIIYEAMASYKRFDYVRVVDGEVAERYALLPSRQYSTHEYLGFFSLNDAIYCLEMYEEGHLVFSRVNGKGRVQAVAEIKMPEYYSYKGYNYQHRARPSVAGNLFNYLFVDQDTIYFGQVVCEPLS